MSLDIDFILYNLTIWLYQNDSLQVCTRLEVCLISQYLQSISELTMFWARRQVAQKAAIKSWSLSYLHYLSTNFMINQIVTNQHIILVWRQWLFVMLSGHSLPVIRLNQNIDKTQNNQKSSEVVGIIDEVWSYLDINVTNVAMSWWLDLMDFENYNWIDIFHLFLPRSFSDLWANNIVLRVKMKIVANEF
jgi:hypothetical protein